MRLYCNYFSQEYLSHNFLIIKALQYRLFYLAKEPVLHGKRASFALQNNFFRFLLIKYLQNKIHSKVKSTGKKYHLFICFPSNDNITIR